MGLKFDNDIADALTLTLRQVGDRAVRGVSDELRKGAEEIQDLAKAYAPYAPPELGGSAVGRQHLQEAIEIEERTDSNRRLELTVFVNGNRLGENGRPIGSYAFLMHELLSPYGAPIYHAREGTQAKGPQAGGKYLERAYNDMKKLILDRVAARAARALRGSSS